jgi:hypothetical protein
MTPRGIAGFEVSGRVEAERGRLAFVAEEIDKGLTDRPTRQIHLIISPLFNLRNYPHEVSAAF